MTNQETASEGQNKSVEQEPIDVLEPKKKSSPAGLAVALVLLAAALVAFFIMRPRGPVDLTFLASMHPTTIEQPDIDTKTLQFSQPIEELVKALDSHLTPADGWSKTVAKKHYSYAHPQGDVPTISASPLNPKGSEIQFYDANGKVTLPPAEKPPKAPQPANK